MVVRCPSTKRDISTGIEIEPEIFARLPHVLSKTCCPACGAIHIWWPRIARLADSDPPVEDPGTGEAGEPIKWSTRGSRYEPRGRADQSVLRNRRRKAGRDHRRDQAGGSAQDAVAREAANSLGQRWCPSPPEGGSQVRSATPRIISDVLGAFAAHPIRCVRRPVSCCQNNAAIATQRQMPPARRPSRSIRPGVGRHSPWPETSCRRRDIHARIQHRRAS